MGKNWNWVYHFKFCFTIFVLHIFVCDSQEQVIDSFIISSSSYGKTQLKPYDWRYIRVELPPWFSSMSFALESDVDLELNGVNNASGVSLPMICFRQGSPPLPDVYNTSLTGLVLGYISNDTFTDVQNLQNVEKCYPMQKNIFLKVSNEQISPGIWYFGLFNGIGPVRTQSKMINRGAGYSFSGNISVEGCTTLTTLGQFCNQTVDMLSCSNDASNLTGINNDSNVRLGKRVTTCVNANGVYCHENGAPKTFLLDINGIVEGIVFTASNVTFHQSQTSIGSRNSSLMLYARHGAMPLNGAYDFSGDISKAPLIIQFPMAGLWYITIQMTADNSNKSEGVMTKSLKACYLFGWQVLQCPMDKAGFNCSSERYALQAVLRRNQNNLFESNFVPIDFNVASPSFPLEPLIGNLSSGANSSDAWTYFLMDVPSNAAGANIHVHLSSDSKINYEIYARYGALPSLSSWDYFFANSTSSSNGSMFFKIYDSKEDTIDFYIVYAKGGIWSFGLRQIDHSNSNKNHTEISLSLERCPHKCSSHGSCQSSVDVSGLMVYSYCSCDRNHGGFDCGVELVSHQGHVRQSIFLIASNAAAVLPAYWSLRNKAFAEWVLFTSSGISSALYHACDVGTWCVLTFRILQFFDFWLSFMAVVSTFVYLSTVSEASKRTIHTIVALLTALMAETGPTSAKNIGYVIGLGTLGLLVGWLLEFLAHYRSNSFSMEFQLNLVHRWEAVKEWIQNIINTLKKRFRWGFILVGFAALTMAGISWKMESTESYWIWHSLWHIFIYTSSFLFLCSKVKLSICENDERSPSNGTYELARQDSLSGGGERRETQERR